MSGQRETAVSGKPDPSELCIDKLSRVNAFDVRARNVYVTCFYGNQRSIGR